MPPTAPFGVLREITASDRRRLLQAAAEMPRSPRDQIAATLTSEQGRPLSEAVAEVNDAAGFLDRFAGEAERIYGQIVPPPRTDKRIVFDDANIDDAVNQGGIYHSFLEALTARTATLVVGPCTRPATRESSGWRTR